MSLNEKEKKRKKRKNEKEKKNLKNTNSAYNMLGGSISTVKEILPITRCHWKNKIK